MEALYILIPLSVVIVFAAIWVFFVASDSGQFDDMVGPAYKILQDDDRPQDTADKPQPVKDTIAEGQGNEINRLP